MSLVNTYGSTWRRWDLHIHTPGTKKEDRYKGKSLEEKWDNFYADIATYVGDGSDPLKAVSVIGITDYLSIDNYLKVIKDNRLPSCIKLVLPNVELRITPIAETPINIHCIFSPDIIDGLEARFFSKLSCSFSGVNYSAARSELLRLGRNCSKEPIDEYGALRKAINQFVIPFEALENLFKNDRELRDNTIIVISNGDEDGVSALKDDSQMEKTRESLYHFTDMIFSSKPSDIKFFLGEKESDSKESIINRFGALKPCIHGCDAHSNDKIFSPDLERFCWIKAEPTFEGLKQLLYEPKDRVRISSTYPDSKPDYQVIDRIEINNPDFNPKPIYLNENLTCIIGGKSTGKSLLLNNIANAISENEVAKKTEQGKDILKIDGLKVIWKDGTSSDTNKNKKILYIPQTYLNKLSDTPQETSEIDKIIERVIMKEEECTRAKAELDESVKRKKIYVQEKIYQLLECLENIKDKTDKANSIGNKESITQYIETLQHNIDEANDGNSLSEDEITEYEKAVAAEKTLASRIEAYSNEIATLKQLNSVVVLNRIEGLSYHRDLVNGVIHEIKEEADRLWLEKKKEAIATIESESGLLKDEIRKSQAIIKTIKPIIDKNAQIRDLANKRIEEQRKLSQIMAIEGEISSLNVSLAKTKKELVESLKSFKSLYSAFADTVNSTIQDKRVAGTVDVEACVVFRQDAFSERMLDLLNNRTITRFTKFDIYQFKEVYLEGVNFISLLEAVLDNSLQLKKEYDVQRFLEEIFADWYNVVYTARFDGDSINEMSPGKKALVLLRLLIGLDESDYPILIDQPEDDLDNRSIFDELIPLLKEKKTKRQIIAVTHNANIVVGGDAELIIVANQEGSDSPNEGGIRFEYRGGALEDDSKIPRPLQKIGTLSSKAIQEHICEILEGGKQAFELRKRKYHIV